MGGLKKCEIRERPVGRPNKEIDWKLVDKLMMAGCSATEIAPHFDMHVQTFYTRFEQHHQTNFTSYCSEKRSQGDSLIRSKQFEKAIEKDNTMLVWLGKNRLKQSDNNVDLNIDENTISQFKLLMSQLGKGQESDSALKIDESNKSNDI